MKAVVSYIETKLFFPGSLTSVISDAIMRTMRIGLAPWMSYIHALPVI